MDRTLRNCVKFHSAQLKSRVTRADTGAVSGVNALNPRAHQIMTTRKKQTPVKKRARSRSAKRGAAGRRAMAARRKSAGAVSAANGRRRDGSLILAADCTVAEAETLKSELTARLQESDPVTIDVSALQRIDTAGLQLLAAFVRDRRTAGRVIAWRGRASALDAAAGLLGLRDMLELPGGADR
jgi:phospholipid transport system transporter-binding protein